MRLSRSFAAHELATLTDARLLGDDLTQITGLNEINRVEAGDLIFVDHLKYYAKALNSPATAVLINTAEVNVPDGKVLLVCADPCAAYERLVQHFSPRQPWPLKALLVGKSTEVHPTAVIGAGVRIGEGCVIHPGVVIYERTTIGDRVIIHANTVIGADPFYFKKRPAGYEKMSPCGSVIIEDDVEIGALCTIDRGVSAGTRIGQGTKLDDQVHVGHDTRIGRHCLIAAQVGIAGACVVQDGVTLWGQVGVASKVDIGANAVVLGQSGIMTSLEGGRTYFGSPAGEWKRKMREVALWSRLPEMARRLGL
jgi:UDP-3-O-[3-hydroxymyristoyl] glucosamine N-acyltransferase